MVEYVVIGKVVGRWGRNKEIKVHPLTDNPKRYENLKKVFIVSPDGGMREFSINKIKKHSSHYLLTFSVSHELELQSIKNGSLLKVHVSDVPADVHEQQQEGTYYYYQIEGLKVITEDNTFIGIVKDVMETGGHSIFVVQGKKEYLIPFIGQVIKEVDLKEERIVITPMDGLLE